MIDDTGKPYVQVSEGPVSSDGRQHYYVCYRNRENVGCVDMTSPEHLAKIVAAAFEEIKEPE